MTDLRETFPDLDDVGIARLERSLRVKRSVSGDACLVDWDWPSASDDGIDTDLAARDTLRSPAMMAAIGVAPRFAEMSASLDRGRDSIVAVVGDLQAKQARRLARIGVKVIKSGDAGRVARLLTGEGETPVDAEGASAAGRPKRLVPYDEEAAAFAAAMMELYELGVTEYADEIRQQGVEPEAPGEAEKDEDAEYLVAAATVAAALLADRMANAWAAEVLRQMRGAADQKALLAAVTGLSGRLLETLASQRVNVALATGRAEAAVANEGVVERVILTAVMDEVTCGPCRDLDGTEYPVAEAPRVPLAVCEGGDRCRCEVVPVVGGAGWGRPKDDAGPGHQPPATQ